MRDATPRDLADLIRGADRIAVFTGAGISTESGIPDYRSKGGLWNRFRPVYYQEFLQEEIVDDARRPVCYDASAFRMRPRRHRSVPS